MHTACIKPDDLSVLRSPHNNRSASDDALLQRAAGELSRKSGSEPSVSNHTIVLRLTSVLYQSALA
jgi:hypothetical protein